MQQSNVSLKILADDILRFGDLLIIGNKGTGKTNTLMQLTKQFRRDNQNTHNQNKIIIFETFPKWMHSFDTIPYLYIRDQDVRQTFSAIELNEDDYFVRTSKDYSILRGTEINEALDISKDLLFTMEIEDTDRISFFISSVIYRFYRKHYLTAYKYGLDAIKQNVIFVCEESQIKNLKVFVVNLFDSTIISKKLFNKLRKMYSESRNLKLHFVMCSQRLQDLNTKIRGRTQLMIGRVNLDDYDLKINRILRNSRYRKEVLGFKVGEFVYAPTDTKIQFNKFRQDGKPFPIEKLFTKPNLEIESKPSLLTRIKGLWQ